MFKILNQLIRNINNSFKSFTLMNSTQLADFQTQIMTDYLNNVILNNINIQKLEKNIWIKAAYKIAPSNLVIRQYCLIDLIKNYPHHSLKIYKLVDKLSYGASNRLWLEGYSYYIYTLLILQPWINKFNSNYLVNNIDEIIKEVNKNFLHTAYYRNGVLFPAPFGDVRDQPLKNQEKIELRSNSTAIVKMTVCDSVDPKNSNVMYKINAKPIGLNCHIPKDDSTVFVTNGVPEFKFYEGYDKKYSSKEEELKDLFDIKRIISI